MHTVCVRVHFYLLSDAENTVTVLSTTGRVYAKLALSSDSIKLTKLFPRKALTLT